MGKEKILILSEESDGTTDRVISWIKYFGVDYLRLNNTSELKFRGLCLSDCFDDVELEYNGNVFALSEFSSYWYRRGRLNLKFPEPEPPLENTALDFAVKETLVNEYDYLTNYIYAYFEKRNKRSIGSIYDNKTNKITNLKIARKVGLRIPATTIVSNKSQIIEFIKVYKKVIIKPIYQRGFYYEDSEVRTTGLSALIELEDVSKFSTNFPPCLLQEYIEKDVELRIFYLNGECFASAIFSQLDEKTKIDFRNYNWAKPNRTPPFKLPIEVANMISDFMSIVKMESGSLDMILTPDNKYVFLEVNPVGQFWQVSYPCNYKLEKKIAKYLSHL